MDMSEELDIGDLQFASNSAEKLIIGMNEEFEKTQKLDFNENSYSGSPN
jgi:hypothetical protein